MRLCRNGTLVAVVTPFLVAHSSLNAMATEVNDKVLEEAFIEIGPQPEPHPEPQPERTSSVNSNDVSQVYETGDLYFF